MCKRCNQNCIYYPSTYTELKKEYYDENGVYHREAVYLCNYDDHRITKFEICNNYRSIYE